MTNTEYETVLVPWIYKDTLTNSKGVQSAKDVHS